MEEASSSSIDSILEFLRKNRFMRAEAALISELSNNSSSSNGVKSKVFDKKQGRDKNQVSDELVVKEIQCGSATESHHQQMNDVSVQTQSTSGANNSSLWEDRFTFSESLVDTELDLPPWNHADSEVYSIDPSITSFVNPRSSKPSSHDKVPRQVSQYDHGKASHSLEDDSMAAIQEGFITTSWPRSEERTDHWKDCSVTTVYPLSKGSTSTNNLGVPVVDKRQGKKKVGASDSKVVIKEQDDDDVETALCLGKSHSGYEVKNLSGFAFSLAHDGAREDLPRLPHVRIKSEDKSMNYTSEEKHERDVLDEKLINTENGFLIGSYLDVPIGQEIHSSGGRIAGGGNWLSVSQGLAEDASDLIFGFGNGLGDLAEHSNEYWDSDEYDDDDDVGYIRQPIEDEAWFLGHEVDYPTEQEKDTEHTQDKSQTKNEDDHSFAEEDSYFSGEQYVLAKGVEPVTTKEPDLVARYDGELMDATELSLMRAEPVWQGLVTHENDLVLSNKGRGDDNGGRFCSKDIRAEDDRNAAVRSIGVGISDDVDDNGCIAPDYFPGEGSEWDLELLPHRQVGAASVKPPPGKGANMQLKSFTNGGFSFPSPVPDGHISHDDSTNPVWSNPAVRNESYGPKGLTESNSMVGRNGEKVESSRSSSPSAVSHSSYTGREHCKEEDEEETSPAPEEDPGTSFEDEDAIVVQEQVRQIKAQEQEFETFNLKIVHRKNRTGFEEDKNFHVVLNSVIAGRYHVTEHLGSAAFSKAIQAHDLHTGIDVCVKIIKNNKDFFDFTFQTKRSLQSFYILRASSTMTLSLRIAPSPVSFRYSPAPSTPSGVGLRPAKQRCRIPNSGVAAKTGSCSSGGVLDLRKRIAGSCVARCSLETVNVSVGEVTEVDKDTFWPIVKAAGDKLVVLDMYTQWCGPCKVMAPKYKELSEKYQDMVFLKLDCNEDNKPVAQELGIRVVPTFKILKDNKVIKEVVGAKFDELLSAIEAARSG